ncbi:MAG: hypothetical protein ACKOWR_01930 [Micrococcales bacterium]
MPNQAELLDSQRRLSGVRANFVVDANGQFTGVTGSSRDLNNEVDLALLKKLRSLSDVIVTDAATARAERYRPSKWAPIQIWSKTGNFQGIQIENGISALVTQQPTSSLKELCASYDSILLETGPTLTRLIAESELIDELKLTVVGKANLDEASALAGSTAEGLGLGYLHISDYQLVSDTVFFTFSR